MIFLKVGQKISLFILKLFIWLFDSMMQKLLEWSELEMTKIFVFVGVCA